MGRKSKKNKVSEFAITKEESSEELHIDEKTVSYSTEKTTSIENIKEINPELDINKDLSQDLSRNFINTISGNEVKKQKKNKSTILLYIFLFIVCAGVIFYTAYDDFSSDNLVSFSEIVNMVGDNWIYLVFAISSFFCVLLFQGLKISFMMKATTHKFNFWLGFKTAIIGKFYDNVTPLGAGGQPFEIYYLQKKGIPLGSATAFTMASFFFSQVMFVLITIVCMVFCPSTISVATKTMAYIGLVCYLFVPLLIILFSFMPRITTKIVTSIINFLGKIKIIKNPAVKTEKAINAVMNHTDSLKIICKNKVIMLLLAIFSIAMHCAVCSIAYFTLKTFNYDIPANGFTEWLQILVMCMILYSAVTIIPTPGNAGASELTFYFIFTTTLSGGAGFAAMMVWRVLSYYAFLIAGAILLVSIKLSAKKKLKKQNTLSD